MGKSLYATRDIAIGETLSDSMFDLRSPAIGLPPSELDSFLGKTFSSNVKSGNVIKESYF
jgi:pseudaminic acid synthase